MLKPVLVGCDDLELDENRMRAFYCEDDRNDKEATYRGTSGTRGAGRLPAASSAACARAQIELNKSAVDDR
jgi:hypothetical protein